MAYLPRAIRAVAPTLALLLPGLSPGVAQAGRYEQLTGWAAGGEEMRVVSATYFGSADAEQFVDAGPAAGGGVVAFGNAWGPRFPSPPEAPRAVVLGPDEHRGTDPFIERKNKRLPDPASPDAAGMIVFYAPGLARIDRVVRFGWGVATIESAVVAADGGLIVSGRCSEAFRGLVPAAKVLPLPRADAEPEKGKKNKRRRGPQFGPYEHKGVRLTGDVYVARLSPDASRFEWAWVLEGLRTPPVELYVDRAGRVSFQCNGVKRIVDGGAALDQLSDKGWADAAAGLRGVDPQTGDYFMGGDRNTHTGREPWRQPYLRRHNADGTQQWSLWGWDSKRVGTDKYRLVSDSSVRDVLVASNGDLLIAGWSDGGNSVFTRQPTDLDKPAPESASPFTTWGMKAANSLAWVMRLDPQTRQTKSWTRFVCYVPESFEHKRDRGAPNHASIKELTVLADGSLAMAGGAATGLIQTPSAFYDHPSDGRKYGGSYVAVWKPDLSGLRFSSYLPGYVGSADVAAVGDAVVVAGTSSGDDAKPIDGKPTPTPTVDAVQPNLGGQLDGHLILLQ